MELIETRGKEIAMVPFNMTGPGAFSPEWEHSFWKQKKEAFSCGYCGETGSITGCTHQTFLEIKCDNNLVCQFLKDVGTFSQWYVCSICFFTTESDKGSRLNGRKTQARMKHLQGKTHKENHVQLAILVRKDCQHGLVDESKKRRSTRDAELQDILGQKFGESMLREYLWCELGKESSGVEPLVMSSCFPSDYNRSEDTALLSDIHLEMLAGYNYYRMSRAARQRVLSQSMQYYHLGRRHEAEDRLGQLRRIGKTQATYRRILPPQSMAEVNQRYVFGPTSMTVKMPIPTVSNKNQGHATTNPIQCVSDLLAQGTPHEPIVDKSSNHPVSRECAWITETPRSEEIMRMAKKLKGDNIQEYLVLPYLVWRDDFEGNNSTKKRESTWCFTMTIAPNRNHRNLLQQTYPLSLGKSNQDHTCVEKYFLNRVHSLMQGPKEFFSYHHADLVRVVAAPYAFLCDQPERRKATRTMLGNSKYHARFRFSANYKSLLTVMRTCNSCLTIMRGGTMPTLCEDCCNWDPEAATPSVVQKLKLAPSKDYPLDHFDYEGTDLRGCYITNDGYLLPFQLTSLRLVQSQKLAYSNVLVGRWNGKQAKSFLERECMSTEHIGTIISNAANEKMLRAINIATVEALSQEEEYGHHLVKRDADENPHLYRMPDYPFSWCIYKYEDSLSLFVDVPMHLLFLGVVKSTLLTLKAWMTAQRMFGSFREKSKKLDRIIAQASVTWLPILEYRSGGFGGWVSENYLAFSRAMCWFFQDIPELAAEEEYGEPPSEKPNSQWKKPHYVHWLRKRDQRVDPQATRLLLHNQVIDLMKRPEGPPQVRETVAGTFTPGQVELVLTSLDEMLHQVMVSKVIPGETASKIDFTVKRFLAEFDRLDQQLKAAKDTPKVISSFNYLCLLNLAQITERFGPIRNMWEGSFKGEGYIQHCKQFLRGGHRKNFATNAMKKCLRETAYKRAMIKIEKAETEIPEHGWESYLREKTGCFCTYKGRADVMEKLSQRGLITIVQSSRNNAPRFFVVTLAKLLMGEFPGGIALYEVAIDKEMDPVPTEIMGSKYSHWTIVSGPLDTAWLSLNFPIRDSLASFAVLLPLLDQSKVSHSRHTLVSHARY